MRKGKVLFALVLLLISVCCLVSFLGFHFEFFPSSVFLLLYLPSSLCTVKASQRTPLQAGLFCRFLPQTLTSAQTPKSLMSSRELDRNCSSLTLSQVCICGVKDICLNTALWKKRERWSCGVLNSVEKHVLCLYFMWVICLFFLYESICVCSHWVRLLSSCVECIYDYYGNSMQDTHAKATHETRLALCLEQHDLKDSSAWQQFYVLHESCRGKKLLFVCLRVRVSVDANYCIVSIGRNKMVFLCPVVIYLFKSQEHFPAGQLIDPQWH